MWTSKKRKLYRWTNVVELISSWVRYCEIIINIGCARRSSLEDSHWSWLQHRNEHYKRSLAGGTYSIHRCCGFTKGLKWPLHSRWASSHLVRTIWCLSVDQTTCILSCSCIRDTWLVWQPPSRASPYLLRYTYSEVQFVAVNVGRNPLLIRRPPIRTTPPHY